MYTWARREWRCPGGCRGRGCRRRPATASQRRPANDEGAGGEFDTDVDPAWSAYTAANTAEAFPGPMTPLSLELSLEAGRITGALSADLLQMEGEVRRALIEEQTGSFGHTIYLNMSVLLATTPVLPGAEPAAWENLLFGVGSTAEVPKLDNVRAVGDGLAAAQDGCRDRRRDQGDPSHGPRSTQAAARRCVLCGPDR